MLKKWIRENAQIRLGNIKYDQNNCHKVRPILIIQHRNHKVTYFRITSRHDNKSKFIQKRLVAMKNWKKAGLTKMSFIDINSQTTVNEDSEVIYRKIGFLSKRDAQILNNRLNQYFPMKTLRTIFGE